MSLCPCGSNDSYEQCCKRFIEDNLHPESPEQLMRSRYTAYTQANIDYIKNTMKDRALIDFNEVDSLQWARRMNFVSLSMIEQRITSPHQGFVEFKALILDKNNWVTLHEISEFHCEEGRWFYIDGTLKNDQKPVKVARNASCPCGSGSKFKNCHERVIG